MNFHPKTLYNNTLQGHDVSFFKLTSIDYITTWINDSKVINSEHFLNVYCQIDVGEGQLLCTGRVCPLAKFLAGKDQYEPNNPFVFNSIFITILRGVLKMLSYIKFKSKDVNSENLYWMGNRVVVAYSKYCRKEDDKGGNYKGWTVMINPIYTMRWSLFLEELFLVYWFIWKYDFSP